MTHRQIWLKCHFFYSYMAFFEGFFSLTIPYSASNKKLNSHKNDLLKITFVFLNQLKYAQYYGKCSFLALPNTIPAIQLNCEMNWKKRAHSVCYYIETEPNESKWKKLYSQQTSMGAMNIEESRRNSNALNDAIWWILIND